MDKLDLYLEIIYYGLLILQIIFYGLSIALAYFIVEVIIIDTHNKNIRKKMIDKG